MKRQSGSPYFARARALLGVALVTAGTTFSTAAQNQKQDVAPEIAVMVSSANDS